MGMHPSREFNSQSTAICVLGMHRSGTSLLTRLLNLLGVELALDEQTVPVAPDNPKGFWEHQTLVALNDEILARFGRHWNSLEPLPEGWQHAAELADLRERAKHLLQVNFFQAPLWGWKDPRTCLTLPFWQSLIGDLKYVICLRNPLDVAASLHRRDGMSLEQSLRLWLMHVEASFNYTMGQSRLIVFYEDVMHNPQRELKRLANFLKLPLSAVEEIHHAADSFISAALQHHSTDPLATIAHPALSFAIKSPFLALRFYVDSLQSNKPLIESTERDQQDLLAHLVRQAAQAVATEAVQEKQLLEWQKLAGERQQQAEALSREKDQAQQSWAETEALWQRQLHEQQQVSAALAQTLSEKEQSWQQLFHEQQQVSAALTQAVAEKEHSWQQLFHQQQQVSAALTQVVAEKEQALQALYDKEQSLKAAYQSLNEITESRGWKLMQMLWKIRRTIVPRAPN